MTRAVALVLVLIAGLATASDAAAGQVSEIATYSGVVGSEARFAFPLPEQRMWEWCRPDTRGAGQEYRWTVVLENDEQTYQFGFFLFNLCSAGVGRGDLAALLRAGQVGVTAETPAGGRFLRNARVRVVPSATQLLIIVRDPETLRMLFSNAPEHAKMIEERPGLPAREREISITYLPNQRN